MITLEGVKKQYGEETTIGPISVELPAGGITALVGPNGAGKSTILTMIGRLLKVDEGRIEVAGQDIINTPSKAVARILSILRQENHFITRLTVRQLVGFGRFPYSKGRLTRGGRALHLRGHRLPQPRPLENRYLDQLSGGQRQRAYVGDGARPEHGLRPAGRAPEQPGHAARPCR